MKTLLYILIFLPFITFLLLLFFNAVDFTVNDKELINSILSNSLGMSSLLLSVLGVLLAFYLREGADDTYRDKIKRIIWLIVPVICVGFTIGIFSILWFFVKLKVLSYVITGVYCLLILITTLIVIYMIDPLLE